MFAIPLSRGKIATSEFWILRPAVTDRVTCYPRLTKIARRENRVRTHTRICTIRQGYKLAGFVYDLCVSESPQDLPLESDKRWESFIWPRWLPIRARLPLIAQLAGVAALMAAVAMPKLTNEPSPTGSVPVVEEPQPVEPLPQEPQRPAHLNLDVRHNFKNVALTVTIDDEPALDTRIDGSGKRFGMFGKREERVFTKTFDLEPGARVVRVRVRSTADKFDQTRVERFELSPASVASLRLVVEKSGLAVFADRPPVVQTVAAPSRQASSPARPKPVTAAAAARAPSVLVEIYQTLRSLLIAMAGFVATTAAGFVVQEFLISRKRLLGL